MNEFPYTIDFSYHEDPVLYEAWLKGQSALKIQEFVTLFRWDCKDGKQDDSRNGFNDYLVALFRQDVAQGWSISEEIDSFKLLPLEIQKWYEGLYGYNQNCLWDEHVADDRYPKLEFADYLREIYSDEEERAQWNIAMPEYINDETSFAWWQIAWILEDDEDDGTFESHKEYVEFCQSWKQMNLPEFKKNLIDNIRINNVFTQDFMIENEDYEGSEDAFINEIEFEWLHEFLQNTYNGWPEDMAI